MHLGAGCELRVYWMVVACMSVQEVRSFQEKNNFLWRPWMLIGPDWCDLVRETGAQACGRGVRAPYQWLGSLDDGLAAGCLRYGGVIGSWVVYGAGYGRAWIVAGAGAVKTHRVPIY